MNKNNNTTNINLTWLLFFGMVTIFGMLNNITAVSSDDEEQKDSFEQKTENSFFNASSDEKGDKILAQATNLLLTATEKAHKDTQQLVNQEIDAVLSSQDAFAELTQEIVVSDKLDISERLNALETCSNMRGKLIEEGVDRVKTIMFSLLDQENMIIGYRLDHIKRSLVAYKDLHQGKMQVQVAEWEQQLKQQEQQLAFDEDKARRNYAFSMQQKQDTQAMRERDLEIELKRDHNNIKLKKVEQEIELAHKEQVYKLKLQQHEQEFELEHRRELYKLKLQQAQASSSR